MRIYIVIAASVRQSRNLCNVLAGRASGTLLITAFEVKAFLLYRPTWLSPKSIQTSFRYNNIQIQQHSYYITAKKFKPMIAVISGLDCIINDNYVSGPMR